MGKLKNRLLDEEEAVELFGDFRKRFVIATDEDSLNVGDVITLVNSNCQFEYDSIRGCFGQNLLYYFVVDLALIDVDSSDYVKEKSNDGGCYAYGKFRVLKVHMKTY